MWGAALLGVIRDPGKHSAQSVWLSVGVIGTRLQLSVPNRKSSMHLKQNFWICLSWPWQCSLFRMRACSNFCMEGRAYSPGFVWLLPTHGWESNICDRKKRHLVPATCLGEADPACTFWNKTRSWHWCWECYCPGGNLSHSYLFLGACNAAWGAGVGTKVWLLVILWEECCSTVNMRTGSWFLMNSS